MALKAFLLGSNTLGLEYAASDANLISEALQKYGYQVQCLVDTNKYHILEQFDRFIDSAALTDTLIFYYSGHGYTPRGDLLLAIDESVLEKLGGSINIHTITDGMEYCRASNKLIILDCCRAGAITDEWNPEQSDHYRILTASGRLEKGKEISEYGASFLTYQIYQGLMAHTRDIADARGNIRVNALFDWLAEQAVEFNEIDEALQVPLPNLLGNQKSNFILASVSLNLPKAGDRLFVIYSDDYWYSATVVKTVKKRVHICFDDGYKKSAGLNEIRWLSDLQLNAAVECRWHGEPYYYPAHILQIDGEKLLVEYDYRTGAHPDTPEFKEQESTTLDLIRISDF